MKKLILVCIVSFIAVYSYSQSIVLVSGSLKCLKEEKVLKFAFSYNDMLVGKMTEADYVQKKVTEYNEKEPGRGDLWFKNWIADRSERYEPKFIELFDKYMEGAIVAGVDGANYVFVMNTGFIEPGFNVGVMRRNASIDMTAKLQRIDTGEQVALVNIRDASANNFWGTDFDSAYRLQETYAKAARGLAKFVIKTAKIK